MTKSGLSFEMHLRRLKPHEADLLRELRLRSLIDAPDSFRDSSCDVAARPPAYWEDFTRSVTENRQHVMFLAFEGDHPVGSAFGLVDQIQAGTCAVGGMWVDPAWRRRGIGEALVREVMDWGRERAFDRMRLWCVMDHVAPISLYRKLGFRETGKQEPLSPGSEHRIVEMALSL